MPKLSIQLQILRQDYIENVIHCLYHWEKIATENQIREEIREMKTTSRRTLPTERVIVHNQTSFLFSIECTIVLMYLYVLIKHCFT